MAKGVGVSKSPVLYDFFSKPYKQTAFEKNQEDNAHNFRGIPATVVSTSDYESLQCVDVRIAIDDVYVKRDNLVLESIVLKKIFVPLPNSGGFKIKMPVTVGDPCRLTWSHRDLGEYLDGNGSNVQLNIKELSSIEDCWCLLDGGTRKNNTSPSSTDMIIEGENTTITITPSGQVSVVTSGTSLIKSSGHTIDAPETNITGTLTVTGATQINNTLTTTGATTSPSIVAQTSLTVNGTEMDQHVHGGVQRGTESTDPV
ncbi:hypothetical protein VPHG_00098 [Vibrio phage 11895-B1]|uniref:hypothetical protein n=1 Tax=Vibrio phage 11895-B1 TaxID=754075 RepID=UPI0002C06AFE|nr:hypothetical protein VPHG_00098 [Vibrio phage 11895-B1]AGH32165.1 hypothetical protein VPHG_00098 [Vibrio phage 11895-B1]